MPPASTVQLSDVQTGVRDCQNVTDQAFALLDSIGDIPQAHSIGHLVHHICWNLSDVDRHGIDSCRLLEWPSERASIHVHVLFLSLIASKVDLGTVIWKLKAHNLERRLIW